MNQFKVGDEVLIVDHYGNDWVKKQFNKGRKVRGIVVKIDSSFSNNYSVYLVQLPKKCTQGHSRSGVIPDGYLGWNFPEAYLAPMKPLAILEEIE